MPIAEKLNSFLRDAGNLVAKETADVISTVIGRDISITLDEIQEGDSESIGARYPDPIINFRFNLSPREEDVVHLFVNQSVGAQMSSLMMMEEETKEFTDDHLDAVKEMGEQVIGNLATVLGEHLNRKLHLGSVRVNTQNLGMDFPDIDNPISLQYTLDMGDGEEEQITQLASLRTLERFKSGNGAPDHDAAGKDESGEEEENVESEMVDLGVGTDAETAEETAQDDMGDLDTAMQELGIEVDASESGEIDELMRADKEEPSPASLLSTDAPPEKIDILLDLSLPVSIELGRTKMLIKDILELGHGSVIEFDKLAGEPVDLLIYDKKVAEGEVVVIEEHFGIRLTNIIKTAERLKSLGGR